MRLAWAVTALVADDNMRFTEADVVAGLDDPSVVQAARVILAKAGG